MREVVDPLDMARDLLNAIHWVHCEPQADNAHLGLWDSIFRVAIWCGLPLAIIA